MPVCTFANTRPSEILRTRYSKEKPTPATPAAPIDLLPADSPFIAASELDLLVCLLRIAQWRHARPREDDTLAPLRQQLARCAMAVQAANLPLRQRSLSPVGLRLLDPTGWLRQR